eukprot:PhM_4_TR18796/c0_g1_i1/m.77501
MTNDIFLLGDHDEAVNHILTACKAIPSLFDASCKVTSVEQSVADIPDTSDPTASHRRLLILNNCTHPWSLEDETNIVNALEMKNIAIIALTPPSAEARGTGHQPQELTWITADADPRCKILPTTNIQVCVDMARGKSVVEVLPKSWKLALSASAGNGGSDNDNSSGFFYVAAERPGIVWFDLDFPLTFGVVPYGVQILGDIIERLLSFPLSGSTNNNNQSTRVFTSIPAVFTDGASPFGDGNIHQRHHNTTVSTNLRTALQCIERSGRVAVPPGGAETQMKSLLRKAGVSPHGDLCAEGSKRAYYASAHQQPVVMCVAVKRGRAVCMSPSSWSWEDAGDISEQTTDARRLGEVRILDLDATEGTALSVDAVATLCNNIGGSGAVVSVAGLSDIRMIRRYLADGVEKVLISASSGMHLLDEKPLLPRDRVALTVALSLSNKPKSPSSLSTWPIVGFSNDMRIGQLLDDVRHKVCEVVISFTEAPSNIGIDDIALQGLAIMASSPHSNLHLNVTYVCAETPTLAELTKLDSIGICAQVELLKTAPPEEKENGEPSLFRHTLFSHQIIQACYHRHQDHIPTIILDVTRQFLGTAVSTKDTIFQTIASDDGDHALVFASNNNSVWKKESYKLERLELDCERKNLIMIVSRVEGGSDNKEPPQKKTSKSHCFCHSAETCSGASNPWCDVWVQSGSSAQPSSASNDDFREKCRAVSKHCDELERATTSIYRKTVAAKMVASAVELGKTVTDMNTVNRALTRKMT